LGLYVLTILGLVGGSIAWYGTQKSITVRVDGQVRTVRTTAATVSGVLDDAKLQVGVHDVIAPAEQARVHSGATIELRRGRLLILIVDGRKREVWTTAPTVEQALASLGYGPARPMGVSRDHRLPLAPTQLQVVTPKQLTVVADGHRRVVTTTAPTVADLLTEIGITVAPADRVSVALTSMPVDGKTVRVQRTRLAERTVTVKIAFKTVSHKDASLYKGTTKVITPGKAGSKRVTYQYVYLDGKLVSKRVLRTVQSAAPRTQVQKVGTKPVPATKTSAGSDPVPVGTAQKIAEQMVTARGWGDGEFACLVKLWNRESHWNVHAQNPSSGAYGIPQAWPGSKMASAGPDWQNNPTTQIKWGLGYIADRYHTPCGAWAQSQASGWY
jgi:uncharacterized protein YabE (DUF348 family)